MIVSEIFYGFYSCDPLFSPFCGTVVCDISIHVVLYKQPVREPVGKIFSHQSHALPSCWLSYLVGAAILNVDTSVSSLVTITIEDGLIDKSTKVVFVGRETSSALLFAPYALGLTVWMSPCTALQNCHAFYWYQWWGNTTREDDFEVILLFQWYFLTSSHHTFLAFKTCTPSVSSFTCA